MEDRDEANTLFAVVDWHEGAIRERVHGETGGRGDHGVVAPAWGWLCDLIIGTFQQFGRHALARPAEAQPRDSLHWWRC